MRKGGKRPRGLKGIDRPIIPIILLMDIVLVKVLLATFHCPSVIGMTFVAMYSLISALIVSMMGKREMVDLPFLKVPIQTPYATLSSDGECMLSTSLG